MNNFDDWYAKSLARSAALFGHLNRPQKKKRPSRKSRSVKNIGKISTGIREKLYFSQKGMCPCCDRPLGKNPHLDHIMPVCLGGTNADENLQLLRATCNLQKNGAHPEVFKERRERRKKYLKERELLKVSVY